MPNSTQYPERGWQGNVGSVSFLAGALGGSRRRLARVVSAGVADDVLGRAIEGQVHSAFRRGLNLCVGDRLLSVVVRTVGTPPNGIALADDTPIPTDALHSGAVVFGDGRCLTIPSAGLTIDLRGATLWSPRLKRRDQNNWPLLSANLCFATRFASARAPQRGFGPLLSRLVPSAGESFPTEITPLCSAAHPAIANVVTALGASDPKAALLAGNHLIGLGDGLTPSGDDFLVGLVAALFGSGHPFAAALAEGWASEALGQTTSVAEVYWLHARQGEFGERVQLVLDALFEGDERQVSQQVAGVSSWGASSGADCLLGILLGFSVVGMVERHLAAPDYSVGLSAYASSNDYVMGGAP